MPTPPLSTTLPGSWRLLSRVDVAASGERIEEPSLGSDPIALVFFDRGGHFAAQFMKRDRSVPPPGSAPEPSGANNTRAQGGYDAYFGTYSVNDRTAPSPRRSSQLSRQRTLASSTFARWPSTVTCSPSLSRRHRRARASLAPSPGNESTRATRQPPHDVLDAMSTAAVRSLCCDTVTFRDV
jgi:hypothetical protein